MNSYKPRNFTPKLLENIRALSGLHTDKLTAELMKTVEFSLNNSVCWCINPDAFDLLWHTQLTPDALENIWLPYDSMVIEYVFDYSKTNMKVQPDGDPAYNRVILLFNDRVEGVDQITVVPFWEIMDTTLSRLAEGLHTPSLPNNWTISAYMAGITRDSMNHIDKWSHDKKYLFGKEVHSPELIPTFPYEELLEEGWMVHAANAVGDEIKLALSLLAVLNTERVPLSRVPAPDKLNKKRRANNKPPIPEYRTLNISHPTELLKRIQGTKDSHGTVRPHWRRGHIRNQPYPAKHEQKKIWIRPTVVGVGEANPTDIKII
jgi:hypothetical protein